MRKIIAIATVMLAFGTGLVGKVHADISTLERDTLTEFYNSTGGNNWIYNTGWLGPSGTECTWHGVLCDNEGNNVIGLGLTENNLNGTIPESLGNLSKLESLHLGNFTDEHDLTENRLTGTIPESLGNLSNLRHLNLWGNALKGRIPASLGNLTNLMILDLGKNNLTGAIPSSLKDMKQLKSLYLNDNHLAGHIPVEFMNLTNLEAVNLSNNNLYTSSPDLCLFLKARHVGADWKNCRSIPRDRGKNKGISY